MNVISILGGRIGNERRARAHTYEPPSHERSNPSHAMLFSAKFTSHHMRNIHKSRLKEFDRANFLQVSREYLLSRITTNIPKFGYSWFALSRNKKIIRKPFTVLSQEIIML